MKTAIFKALLTVVGAILVYFLIRSRLPEDISTELATNFGILGFIGAGVAWLQGVRLELMQHRREKHANERIRIVLRYEPSGGESIDHPVPHMPRRGNLSRAELQGILRTIERDNEHAGGYDLVFMRSPEWLEIIDDVTASNSKVNEIVIPYYKKQFAWD